MLQKQLEKGEKLKELMHLGINLRPLPENINLDIILYS
jgi:hypothetical protein